MIIISDESIDLLADTKLLAMQENIEQIKEAVENEALTGDTVAEFIKSFITTSDADKRLKIAERMAIHFESAVNTYLECRAWEEAEIELKEEADDRLCDARMWARGIER